VKVNVDEAPAQQYQVTGVAAAVSGGQVRETTVGLVSARALRALLDRIAPPAGEPQVEPAPRFG
jgi:hypothetical protein